MMVISPASNPSGASAEEGTLDTFAQCLDEKRATMYGSFLHWRPEDDLRNYGVGWTCAASNLEAGT
jgi:hypothetical protein